MSARRATSDQRHLPYLQRRAGEQQAVRRVVRLELADEAAVQVFDAVALIDNDVLPPVALMRAQRNFTTRASAAGCSATHPTTVWQGMRRCTHLEMLAIVHDDLVRRHNNRERLGHARPA